MLKLSKKASFFEHCLSMLYTPDGHIVLRYVYFAVMRWTLKERRDFYDENAT